MGRIADAVEDEPDIGAPRRNKVDRILDELDDADRAIVETWLHDVSLSDLAVEETLEHHDVFVSDTTIRKWRIRRGIRWAG